MIDYESWMNLFTLKTKWEGIVKQLTNCPMDSEVGRLYLEAEIDRLQICIQELEEILDTTKITKTIWIMDDSISYK